MCQKHDLGHRGSAEPHVISEDKQNLTKGQEFWKILGGREKYLGKKHKPEEHCLDARVQKRLASFSLKFLLNPAFSPCRKDNLN